MKLAAFQGLLRSLAVAADALGGQPARRRARDRALLERCILPAYAARADVRRLLFVGCARYTVHYAHLFGHIEYWTLDAAPRARRWGAAFHVCDRLEALDRHVPPAYFDAILCNGVLGWGLNRREDAEAAFDACHRALRPGGDLVLGWNDVFPRNVVRPEDVDALKHYSRCTPHGLGAPVLLVDTPHRHVFEFYRKAGAAAGHADRVVGARGAGAQSDIGLHAPATHSS